MGNFLSIVSRLKTETILLVGILPFVGWIVAFCFEQGYLGYFGFSYDFIEIGLTQTMAASLILLLLAYCAGVVAIFGEPLYAKGKSRLQKGKDVWMLVVFLIIIVMSVLFATSGNKLTFLVAASLIFSTFCLIYTLHLVTRLFKRAVSKTRFSAEFLDGIRIARQSKPTSLLVLVAAIFLTLASVKYFGKVFAAQKIEFLVLAGNPDYVLVRRYGDTYLFRQIDRVKHRQLLGVKTLKMGDGKEVDMTLEYVGSIFER